MSYLIFLGYSTVCVFVYIIGIPCGSEGKEPAMWENQVRSLGQEDSLEKEMATHSIILVWKIPWTEKPGRLESMGLQRVRHD